MPRGDQTCKKFTVEAAVKDQGGQSRRRWEGPSGHGVGLAARGEREEPHTQMQRYPRKASASGSP